MVGPFFLLAVFGIMWLSASLFAQDIQSWHDAERRLQRCPVHL